jgi:two-component system response regulator HydG
VPPVEGLVGEAPSLQSVHALLRKIAPSELAVLVSGESGTGKELAARALHALSRRAAGPFVAENCAALPATLLESELFGSRKGSYTGSERDREGLFERASGGTLFLDEIGELPLDQQAKLLRVLETHEVRRIGDTEVRKVDFRLVAATNRDLTAEVQAGRFREDLLYRLDTVRVVMPPLRERLQDLPLLVAHFLRLAAARDGRTRRVTPDVLTALAARPWPGNVRELANEVARLVVLSDGDLVDPALVRTASGASAPAGFDLVRPLEELERDAILAALTRTNGDKRRAAELLGISRAKVYQRLKDWRQE